MRREVITWAELEMLIDHLIPQFEGEFDAMLMVTRGGIVPGGMLAEAMNLTQVLTAAVDFPCDDGTSIQQAAFVAAIPAISRRQSACPQESVGGG